MNRKLSHIGSMFLAFCFVIMIIAIYQFPYAHLREYEVMYRLNQLNTQNWENLFPALLNKHSTLAFFSIPISAFIKNDLIAIRITNLILLFLALILFTTSLSNKRKNIFLSLILLSPSLLYLSLTAVSLTGPFLFILSIQHLTSLKFHDDKKNIQKACFIASSIISVIMNPIAIGFVMFFILTRVKNKKVIKYLTLTSVSLLLIRYTYLYINGEEIITQLGKLINKIERTPNSLCALSNLIIGQTFPVAFKYLSSNLWGIITILSFYEIVQKNKKKGLGIIAIFTAILLLTSKNTTNQLWAAMYLLTTYEISRLSPQKGKIALIAAFTIYSYTFSWYQTVKIFNYWPSYSDKKQWRAFGENGVSRKINYNIEIEKIRKKNHVRKIKNEAPIIYRYFKSKESSFKHSSSK